MGDAEGLFGPGSMVWRVHADPASLVGGMRALLYQALNPRAMAGVDQYSDFRADPWGRFQRTAGFVTTATFGTRTDAEALGATVRRIHTRVRGTDPVTGREYRADDPDLLAWVHNVLVDSLLSATRRYGRGPVGPDADRYLREMVRMAELVGTPVDLVPTTVADLRDELSSAELVISPVALAASRTVLAPPLPAWARAPWALLDTAAVAVLPVRVRRLYGLRSPAPRRALVRVAVTSLLGGLQAVTAGPPELRAARARLAA